MVTTFSRVPGSSKNLLLLLLLSCLIATSRQQVSLILKDSLKISESVSHSVVSLLSQSSKVTDFLSTVKIALKDEDLSKKALGIRGFTSGEQNLSSCISSHFTKVCRDFAESELKSKDRSAFMNEGCSLLLGTTAQDGF